MPKAEEFAHAEERRLLYVALTRARYHVYLISDADKASDFVRELVDQGYEINVDEFTGEGFQDKIADILCSECETDYRVARDSKHGSFFGCSQYPLCTHTEAACQWCGSGMREKSMSYALFVKAAGDKCWVCLPAMCYLSATPGAPSHSRENRRECRQPLGARRLHPWYQKGTNPVFRKTAPTSLRTSWQSPGPLLSDAETPWVLDNRYALAF
ncbi:topoisomerase DNA-binding C4 zinc finger domain-containing protein [Methylicorpusculum oleiharenae]|uniref:topoisomerase DNA-binding C4 zinc finger domain-containing protein n=1 Tax=Methylicorpusculum oleiharenae TaxID=1338687 RepID=UPI001E58F876|nr:topoisomerase DNA-binding C4 zinc finger domain-containing protein [Methylicorpusculum oleiharenae]MCD2451731.1 topoisomerase DNA-binding C4 zinc finger domain-containing protein [Methylicorpusculum oleiharenae]